MLTLSWLQPLQLQLGQLALSQQLHHALLFTGAVGVGKHQVAKHLAQQLLCQQPHQDAACGHCKSCLLVKAGHHPDLLQLHSDSSLGVDAVRELSHFMQGSPQQGGARVVLLPQAHKMTEAAANALLKTLEEPGDNSFLLLQTAHEQQLLPTILSRCQRWQVPGTTDAAAHQWLTQHSNRAVPPYLLAYCAGAPLQALQMLESGESDQIDMLLQLLPKAIDGDYPLAELVKQLEALPQTSSLFSWFIRQQLWQQPVLAANPKLFARLAQWCRDEQQILGQNKTLALTAFLLELPRLLR